MIQYYYLVASLPLLTFDTFPQLNSQKFLEECQHQVTPDDYDLLKKISIFEPAHSQQDHEIWQKYAGWETAMRNELVLQRSTRLNISPDPFIRPSPYFTQVAGMVKDALTSGNPKAVEKYLDRQRWYYLDELQNETQFSVGFLIVYRLKLMILERIFDRNFDQGKESFHQQYSEILGEASKWTQVLDRSIETEKVHD